jgi:hypothetical protein
MRKHLRREKGFRRFGVAMAVGALATVGLVPAVSASGASAGAGAATAAAPRSSNCESLLVPSRFWITDPTNRTFQIWNPNNDRPGSRNVAYKFTGRFPHSTTMNFTAYNNLLDINGPNYALNDVNIIPDPGSVNPFVPGTRIMAPNRNYTVWAWPDNVPVPAGLKNVILYPTRPEDPGGAARWNIVTRMYYHQPGFSPVAEKPTITAMSALNPTQPVACPLSRVGTIASQIAGFFAHRAKWGAPPLPPQPPNSNKIYFTRYPTAYGVGLDGYPGPVATSCANYLVATVPFDGNKVSVTTMHRVPEHYNINNVTQRSVMKDYPIRYQSVLDTYFTLNGRLYRSLGNNTNDSVYTSKGEWVFVWLPSEPRLPAAQERAVRAKAAALNFNVIQLPPKATGPIQRQLPNGILFIRQKGISPNFPYSNQGTPCWADDHDYTTYAQQNSPAFFAKYASSPANNGPYWTDGVKQTVGEFLSR